MEVDWGPFFGGDMDQFGAVFKGFLWQHHGGKLGLFNGCFGGFFRCYLEADLGWFLVNFTCFPPTVYTIVSSNS